MTEVIALAVAAPHYPAETIEVRPLVASDGDLLQDFVRGLSPTARYQRFQNGIRELAPGVLAQLMDIDYRASMAFVAVVSEQGQRRIIGEARYAAALDESGAAEFALAVADAWQGQGLGRLLFARLLQYAERAGVAQMQGDVLHGNRAMLGLARRSGFAVREHPDGAWLTRVERTLQTIPIAA